MAIDISIKADVKDAIDYLKDYERNDKKITRAVLAGVGSSVRNAVKKDYKNHFHKRTGSLYKGITRKVNKKGDAVYIFPKARSSNNILYGYPLAYGSDIKPKNDEYMRFQIEGKWVTSKGFKLQGKNWVEAPAKQYLNSPQYQEQLDRIMAKQVARIEKKRGLR